MERSGIEMVNKVNRTVTFQFDDKDIVEIIRLEAEGFRFATITLRDQRGYERAFKIWVPPQYSAEGEKCNEK
jgi:hypothetical protein